MNKFSGYFAGYDYIFFWKFSVLFLDIIYICTHGYPIPDGYGYNFLLASTVAGGYG
jgi:hypothetical protein